MSSPAVDATGTVYLGGSDEHFLYAVSSVGALKWKLATGGAVSSSPAIGSDGAIYVGCDDHELYAVTPMEP